MTTQHHPIPRSPRILSIQSHVVSGYCGNKSATLPLQLLDFEVDVINSVQLSNHTQYKVALGQIFTSKDLEKIHRGLAENQLLQLYDNILTGYVADVGYIESMAKLIAEIKETRRTSGLPCFYSLDPVLGDDGPGYYVPSGVEIAEAYKKHLLPMADIITPNRFEASILSGVKIDPKSTDAINQAIQAIKVLHGQYGVKVVVITSLDIKSAPGELVCIVSKAANYAPSEVDRERSTTEEYQENGREEQQSVWSINVPKFDCPFTGTGDLFTALLTGWLQKTRFDIKTSLENTVNTIHDILEDTLKWFNQAGDRSVQSQELRIVQNRDRILHPTSKLKAHLFNNYGSNNINMAGSLSISPLT